MATREELREGIKDLIKMYNPQIPEDEADWEAGLYMHYLHSQGVVIKAARGIPVNPYENEILSLRGIAYELGQNSLLESGYEAVESLVEE